VEGWIGEAGHGSCWCMKAGCSVFAALDLRHVRWKMLCGGLWWRECVVYGFGGKR
jgi:hypothetical protein